MDDGAGAAVGTFVAVGTAYLLAEFMAMALAAALVGAAFVALVGLVLVASTARWVYRNPRPVSAKAWALFVSASSTMLCLPFLIMWSTVLHGQSSRDVNDMTLGETLLGPLCFFGLAAIIFWAIPMLYRHCAAMSAVAPAAKPAPALRPWVSSPTEGPRNARVLAVERLASDGRLAHAYARHVTADGHVSDAVWRELCRYHPDLEGRAL